MKLAPPACGAKQLAVARFLALLLGCVLAACATGQDSKADKRGRAVVESTTVPGLRLELREVSNQKTYPHSPRGVGGNATEFVDRKSKLELGFKISPVGTSAEMRELESLVTELEVLVSDYIEINRRADRSGGESAAREIQTVAKAFDVRQRKFEEQMKAAGVLPSEQVAYDEWLLSQENVYQGMHAEIAKRIESLRTPPAAAENKGKKLVTVTATLDPAFGPEQLLQVPEYSEKVDDELQSKLSPKSAEWARLKAEFDAAKRVAAGIDELQDRGAELLDDLRIRAVALGAQTLAILEERLQANLEQLNALLDAQAASDNVATPEQTAAWESLKALETRCETLLEVARALDAALAGKDTAALLQSLLDNLGKLNSLWNGNDASPKPLPELVEDGMKALGKIARDELRTLTAAVKEQLDQEWKELLEDWKREVPEIAAAAEMLKQGLGLGQAASAPVDDPTQLIAHPADDLPDAVLSLPHTPVLAGDRLELKVQFWDEKAFKAMKAGGEAVLPEETIVYDTEIMKSGWLWSGDVIFAQQLTGPNHRFNGNAAVSYEYRPFDRRKSMFWRPGIGFHAAQLNFDPDEAVEIGAGVNFSLWDGLLRVGVGYNISAVDDNEYWYFGFGVIAALDKMKSIADGEIDED